MNGNFIYVYIYIYIYEICNVYLQPILNLLFGYICVYVIFTELVPIYFKKKITDKSVK